VVARRIVYGWLLTLPAAAAVGALVFGIIDVLGGDVVGVVVVIAVIAVIAALLLWRANKSVAVEPDETISQNTTFGRGASAEATA
jgi:PiT family inorganic phosphate transporter